MAMITGNKEFEFELRHAHLFCGIGAGAKGFNQAHPVVGKIKGKWVCAGGIDVDAGAVAEFERQTGVKGTVIDLFSREQYEAFHGHEPPFGWVEAGPEDIRRAWGDHIDSAFLSAPCKGFSGLLSNSQSKTDKYQALNRLTLRGIWMVMEAYKDDPISIILFENVPRIATRGRELLDHIIAILRAYGYHVNEGSHDCGELGELAQSRKRFLLIARHPDKIPPFIYQPPKFKLRGVGEVIGKLPLPGDPVGGIMHRVPSLQWKTWVRLAFVPAGKDWRALNDLAVEGGMLKDYGIMPDRPMRDNALGVCAWSDSAPLITGARSPGQGRFSVADIRYQARDATLGVVSWKEHLGAIQARTAPSNGRFSVADPRITINREGSGGYGVWGWHGTVGTIQGASRPANGAYAIADIRTGYGESTHQNILSVVRYDRASKSILGAKHVAGGALSVADPRLDNGHPKSVQLGVRPWTGTAPCIKGDMSVGTGPYAIADIRLPGKPKFNNCFRIVKYDGSSPAVAGPGGPAGGLAVADPRQSGSYESKKYKITPWEGAPARAVIGASTTGDGAFAVADPRPAQANISYRQYGVLNWGNPAIAVSGQSKPGGGPYAVADPRPSWGNVRRRNILAVTSYGEPVGTIAGTKTVTGGQACVADERREHYQTGGHYGVVGWGQSAYSVPGYAKYDRGWWSVADPRDCEMYEDIGQLPKPEDRLVCRIIALDETWHRPFTTLELGSLQSIIDPEEAFGQDEDGNWFARIPFEIEATSDATKREWIGNAVPSKAAKAMATTIGETIILARIGETFTLSTREIWVKPGALALAIDNDQVAWRMDS